MRRPDYDRRVVVTGLGVISPVGNDKASAWSSLVNGRSGLDTITKFDPSPYEAKPPGAANRACISASPPPSRHLPTPASR
jgi:3-oxoacyl-[acyl-carrier-protein] synthase II